MKVIFVKPGEIAYSQEPALIRTVLGSCVSVCIFDKRLKVGGLNHFVLPTASDKEHDPHDNRYGEFAIPNLLKIFKTIFHSRREDLEIKLIGGAEILKEKPSVGGANAKFAVAAMEKYALPVTSRRFGGTRGIKIEFNTANGELRFRDVSDGRKTPLIPPVQAATEEKIRVLIVDDTKTIRMMIRRILESCPRIEIVGEAEHPIAAEKIRKEKKPHVMTLDLNMPMMDGVTYLKQFMRSEPIPAILITDNQLDQSGPVFDALEHGAFDYINKGELGQMVFNQSEFTDRIIAAYQYAKNNPEFSVAKRNAALNASFTVRDEISDYILNRHLVLIGASTGGTEAIKDVFMQLPAKIPPILVVQHIPPIFSKAFADRLNDLCRFPVKELEDGDEVMAGRAIIARGGLHMRIEEKHDKLRVFYADDPPVNRFKPSVDYMFRSALSLRSKHLIAALLTGMGNDGAHGLLDLRHRGCKTIAQDEKSSVVFGMPKAAIELNAADKILPLSQIAQGIFSFLKEK